ncbi:hypothetical protein AAG906_032294 [Vitis piasezkii]
MAEICCGVVSDGETSTQCEPSSRVARRRRMELRRFKFVAGVAPSETENGQKRRKLEAAYPYAEACSWKCANTFENCASEVEGSCLQSEHGGSDKEHPRTSFQADLQMENEYPKFGIASVCGRRRDMEDAVAVHPSFLRQHHQTTNGSHYFGVYDGHGCSHVAMNCRDRMHELVREELENKDTCTESGWKNAMERSFSRMDKEVNARNIGASGAVCRCELQTPECDAVGSTAVVAIVTPEKIVVANCGDSRAVLCRNGKAIPLSSDHKPDRPDELQRIQSAGGRVIFWDGPRVLGVLAMSRAIGDNYLKPFVSCEPEVTITERSAEDECLILASDGLWDVVSNETACGVARMCLKGKVPEGVEGAENEGEGEAWDKACSDASMLLTKLALARHTADNVSVVVVDLRKDT